MSKHTKTPRADEGRKRIVVLSDLHSGHLAGLTPPAWQFPLDPAAGARHDAGLAQREAWEWYVSTLRAVKPLYAVFVLGDCIDGRGEKSGGIELITADRQEQCDIAEAALRECECANGAMVYGTGYHCAGYEQWENLIARRLGYSIGKHEWPRINGVTFDLKHHLGSSQIPHGRHTASARDRLQNILWARDGAQPDSDVILRGHVHYHQYCGGYDRNPPRRWAALTCPALQLANTQFGGLRMSGQVHFGIVVFDTWPGGAWEWRAYIAPLVRNSARVREM